MHFGISNAVVLAKANNYKIKEYKEDVMKALATIMGIIAPATAFAASEASGGVVFLSGSSLVSLP